MRDTLDAQARIIFDRVLDHGGPERMVELDRACAGDAKLRLRVQALLAAAEKDDSFLGAPTLAAAEPVDGRNNFDQPGSKIGPYELVDRIGEGGFGAVFLARQSTPVQRDVALKIIKAGMDTRQVIARFEAERRTLARMEHPNIARVLDAGATENGRPYFVMELVRGEPITRFCDREELAVPQRLDLLRSVCAAVQHAHQKGIIHRDLKPSNILVGAAEDGTPTVKVIDFGIAKAVLPDNDDGTLTGFDQRLGTPNYMSPEQLQSGQSQIDTRTDVYSLGVVLYELLTGSTPFQRTRTNGSAKGDDPQPGDLSQPLRPSARVRSLINSSQQTARSDTPTPIADPANSSSIVEVAKLRRTAPATLVRTLKRDLDWIVLKCLEHDRARRYASAAALAEDVERHLTNQPVVAAPPGARYRLGKFVRRNRAGVIAGTTVAAALLVGTGVSIYFGLSEARQRRAAELDRGRAHVAETEARARADELEQVAQFQAAQLSGIDVQVMGAKLRAKLLDKARAAAQRAKRSPEEVQSQVRELEKLIAGSDFTGLALDALDENVFQRTLTAIDERFSAQPLVKARLLQTAATTLRELGLLDASQRPQEEALTIRTRDLGREHADTLESMNENGHLLLARSHHEAALACYREALETCRRVKGDEHVDTLGLINNVANVLDGQGKSAEALPLLREALEVRRRKEGDDSRNVLHTRVTLARILRDLGQADEADRSDQDVLERRRRVFGEIDPDTIHSISSIGSTLVDRGNLKAAEPYVREALEKRRRVFGDEHPDTLQSLYRFGALLQNMGRPAEAEPCYIEALGVQRRILGDDHVDTIATIAAMGSVLKARGRLAEALPYCTETLERSRRMFGEDHPLTLTAMVNQSLILCDLRRLSEAETLCREALEKCRRHLGDENRITIDAVNNLGILLFRTDRASESEPYLRETVVMRRKVLGNEHPGTKVAVTNFGMLLQAQGKLAEAEPYFREALEHQLRTLSAEHPYTLTTISALGSLLEQQGEAARAVEMLQPAEQAARRAFTGDNAIRLGRFLSSQGRARKALGDFAQARENLIEAHEILSVDPRATPEQRTAILADLVELYEAWHAANPNDGHNFEIEHWRRMLKAWTASTQPAVP